MLKGGEKKNKGGKAPLKMLLEGGYGCLERWEKSKGVLSQRRVGPTSRPAGSHTFLSTELVRFGAADLQAFPEICGVSQLDRPPKLSGGGGRGKRDDKKPQGGGENLSIRRKPNKNVRSPHPLRHVKNGGGFVSRRSSLLEIGA